MTPLESVTILGRMDAVTPLQHLLGQPLLLVHLAAALLSLALGPINILRRRRDRTHRMVGRTWVAAMVVTCLTSFGLRGANGGYSWLHGLSVFTLVTVTLGVVAIRRGNRRGHVGNMVGSLIGIWIAFLFAALVPDRTIAQVASTDPWTVPLTLVLVAAAVGLAWWAFRPTAAGRRSGPHPGGGEKTGAEGGQGPSG